MVIALIVVVGGYLITGMVVARTYYRKRHLVGIERGAQGTVVAGQVGLWWPATLWLPSVRDPMPCNHSKHILAYQRAVEDHRELQRIKEQRQSSRGPAM